MREYNGGRWTAARFRGFITGALRNASNRWAPKYETRKLAHKARASYECAGYGRGKHLVTKVTIDHVTPVIDPIAGFTTWDEFIDRLFCEKDNLQALCLECHKRKTKDERSIRTNSAGVSRGRTPRSRKGTDSRRPVRSRVRRKPGGHERNPGSDE